MATKQRLIELAKADMDRECALYASLCGEVTTRMGTDAEIAKYKEIGKIEAHNAKWRKVKTIRDEKEALLNKMLYSAYNEEYEEDF